MSDDEKQTKRGALTLASSQEILDNSFVSAAASSTCTNEATFATPATGSDLPEVLADDFGDPVTLLNSRNWLQAAIEAKGAKINGGGAGGGQCDLDFTLDGCKFNVSLRPIIKALP